MGGSLREPRTNQPCQTTGGGKKKNGENPLRPGAEQDKFAFRENCARILEKELKHCSGGLQPKPAPVNLAGFK
jgi:hypothetical protein